LAPVEWRGLPVRVVSALVLAPPALATLYAGPPYSDALVLLVCGLAAWEWARLCRLGRIDAAGAIAIAAVVAAVAASAWGDFALAGWVMATGAMASVLLTSRDGQAAAIWLGLGVVYLSAAGLAFVWLRGHDELGWHIVVWLIAVVVATDVGAYFAGRAIGGPKLAPSISPKKTWAGLIGGAVLALVVGIGVAALMGREALGHFALLGVALAITSQLGDLLESSLKRRFGTKDSSNLIPGHGGVLDRIDGLLAGALMLGGLNLLTKGAG
jgi:phosphatidate cytidylyltransferase